MLSAIAARKARLQQPNILSPENHSENNPQLTPPPKTSTKRRHGHQANVNLSVKKPRKNTSSGHSGVLNRFTPQDDVIILDNSDDDSDISTNLDQDNPASALVQPEPSARRGKMKAWSPSCPVVDSSDDASDTSDQPSTDIFSSYNRPLTSEEPEVLSTYHPIHDQNIFQLSLNEGSALGLNGPALALVLSPSATVSFVGTYRLRVLRGSISILGTTVAPSHVLHHVFAPRSSPVPVIQALVACGESSTSLPDIPARILSVVDDGDVVILLQELRTGIEGIGHVMRTFEGAFDHVNLEGPSDIPLEGIHLVTETQRGMCAFQLPPSWEAALSASPFSPASLPEPHVLLVRGQKNSGKSTFARILNNRLCSRYRRVAFLECDLGQSEFTPGGMVALSIIDRYVFGPPFTHPTLPHQAHYVGANNPRSSPSHYLSAIQALMENYRLDLQFATSLVGIEDDEEDDRITDIIPLVVNTMGWTKGLGGDLTRRIVELVQPTEIFSFDTSPPDGTEPGDPRVHTLEPITPSRRFTPSDHRALSLLSYFHAVFPNPTHSAPLRQSTASLWSTDVPLCAWLPYELTLRLALDRIVLIGAGAEDVVRTELVRVLAGALVALVSSPRASDSNEELYTPGSPPPDPATSSCLGLAIVRGVSSDGSKLQLLTPVPPEVLVNARILVMGELGLPVWGWLDFRSVDGGATEGGKDLPFLRWGRSTGLGSERRRVRRNIMRRAQM